MTRNGSRACAELFVDVVSEFGVTIPTRLVDRMISMRQLLIPRIAVTDESLADLR